MAKRTSGLFTLLTGMAAGAAALFLSDEKNRQSTKKELSKAGTTAKKLKSEYDKDPAAFKVKVHKDGKKLAQKAVKKAQTKAKKAKTSAKKAKKTAKKQLVGAKKKVITKAKNVRKPSKKTAVKKKSKSVASKKSASKKS
jgi:hypothetical protein